MINQDTAVFIIADLMEYQDIEQLLVDAYNNGHRFISFCSTYPSPSFHRIPELTENYIRVRTHVNDPVRMDGVFDDDCRAPYNTDYGNMFFFQKIEDIPGNEEYYVFAVSDCLEIVDNIKQMRNL